MRGGGLASGSATAAPREPTTLPAQYPCQRANELIAAKKPEEAIAWIDRLRGPLPQPTPAELTGRSILCEEQRRAALEQIAYVEQQPAPRPSDAQQVGKSWSDFLAAWVTPLAAIAAAFLGVLTAFLVSARVLALLSWIPDRRSAEGRRWWSFGLGLAAVTVATVLLTVSLSGWTTADGAARRAGSLVVAVSLPTALGVLGAFGIASFLATRLRVSVEVRDEKGAVNVAATTRVIALLHDLGGAVPRGLEVPRGSDVTVLKDTKLDATPASTLLAGVQRIATLLVGATPWRIVIDARSGVADRLSVVATRNGWTIATAVIEPASLGLLSAADGPALEVDPEVMAAAFVLTTLATRHTGFEGLCGATDWRSVGLQYLATKDRVAPAGSCAALAVAVTLDPNNLPAAIALRHALDRDSTDRRQLQGYVRWLDQTADELWLRQDRLRRQRVPDWPLLPLLCRVLLALIVSVLNWDKLRADLPSPTVNDAQWAEALDRAALLCIFLIDPGLPEPLASQMRATAATSFLDIARQRPASDDVLAIDQLRTVETWATEADWSSSPTIAYNLACHRAVNEPSGGQDEPTILELLRVAFTDAQLKVAAAKDSELATLWTEDEYAALLATPPRQSYWALDPFATHRVALADAGLLSMTSLAKLDSWWSSRRLARYLDVDTFAVRRLLGMATIADRMERLDHADPPIGKYRVEVLAALVQMGVASPADIATLASAEQIADTVKARCGIGPSEPAVSALLQTVRRGRPPR